MPTRATKRGDERTPLTGEHDVLICGASFAGLAVARELAGSGADVLVIDRYEIGERQTSACGIPTMWLEAMGLEDSARQEFDELVVHTPHGTSRYQLPFTFSTFDYRELCRILWEQSDARFETAKVEGRDGRRGSHRPRRPDGAADRRRARLEADPGHERLSAPRRARSRAASRCTPKEAATTSRSGSTAATCPPDTAGRSPPATSSASASAPSTPASTSRTRPCCWPRTWSGPPVRYQGNWIPHKLRGATEDGIFFAGDSAGHCLPLTAEGIRTAFYFGIACGRELRAVYDGRKTKEAALRDYAEFNDSHEWKFRWMLRVQKLVPRLPARVQRAVIAAIGRRRFVRWSFGHYLQIAPPEFAGPAPEPSREPELSAAA